MVSPRYLIDANVLSEPLRARPERVVVERLDTLRQQSATAAPVVHELVYGFRRLPPSRRRTAIEEYINDFVLGQMTILSYDAAAAQWHAAERARLVGIGRTPPYLDGQIAAVAAVNGLVLVTFNLADFQHFSGLQIEDWRS